MECEIPGNRPNAEKTVCVDKTLFPVIGPIFSFLCLVILIMVIIVKRFKKDTNFVTSLIALIGCVETLSIFFNLYLTVFHELYKYSAFALLALVVSYILNIYNNWYVKNKVQSSDAKKVEKLKQKKVKEIIDDCSKKAKRDARRADREEIINRKREHENRKFQKEQERANNPMSEVSEDDMEGGSIEMVSLENFSDIGDSISQRAPQMWPEDSEDYDYDGGDAYSSLPEDDELPVKKGCFGMGKADEESEKIRLMQKKNTHLKKFMKQNDITFRDGEFYKSTSITDRGFNKWVQAYESTAKLVKWVGLLLSFKFYRMTYSYFMGDKKFLVIFQKKKFKKHTVMVTLISQFLVKLPLLVSGIVSISSLPFGE